jgi:hypothetical protein
MLDQILNLVKQIGQETVVENPEVPNEYNNDVMAEATKTVAGGLQNVMAGGGLENIISLFRGGGNAGSNSGGIGGLLKNPIVSMMIGHFISKLVGKFRMSPAAASNVSNNLIPNVLSNLITRTQDPNDSAFDLNKLIGSLTGGHVETADSGGGFDFQNLIKNVTGGNGGGNGFNIQDIISRVTRGAQENQAEQAGRGGGILDMVKGFFN